MPFYFDKNACSVFVFFFTDILGKKSSKICVAANGAMYFLCVASAAHFFIFSNEMRRKKMFCKNCGTALPEDARFCSKCGEDFNHATSDMAVEARWETVSKEVAPSREESVIKEYEAFGWEVHTTQKIDTKDSHLENYFGDIYSVTETEKYVKLTFRRNTNMKNYEKIAELEKKYRATSSGSRPNDAPKWKGAIGVMCIWSFGAMAIYGSFLGAIGVFGTIIGLLLFGSYIVQHIKYKKEYPEYLDRSNKASSLRAQYKDEAKKILNGK